LKKFIKTILCFNGKLNLYNCEIAAVFAVDKKQSYCYDKINTGKNPIYYRRDFYAKGC